MKVPRNPFDPVAKKAALFEILDATARHGKVCPRISELCRLLAISDTRIDELLKALRSDGMISWQTVYCGTGLGNVRIVTIRATGATTARPQMQSRPVGSLAAAKADLNQIERAKTALRRLGRVVFDAEITGGPKGLIRVDSKDMKPAEVVALAQQTGAI